MSPFKAWLLAARLRTLPLSLSGIITGTALGIRAGYFDLSIFVLALLTTVGFQITSNFANDYGDGVKGTDNENRIGPQRALQAGLLSRTALKKGIVISVILSLLLATVLLWDAFGKENMAYFTLFIVLGALCVWAAIRYTMGTSPYGYRGLGDVAVFIFFGLIGVLGSMFLYTKAFDGMAVFPAVTIGLLCVGVLNLNNLRDVESDKLHGKNTLIVLMGFKNGKRYHLALLTLAFLSLVYYGWATGIDWQHSFYLLVFLPIGVHLVKVMKTKEPKLLDPELKKLALSTFFLSVLFIIAVNYFL